jgi:hypothetical protein
MAVGGPDASRRCTRCGMFKPVTEFHRRGRGRPRWCKSRRRDSAYYDQVRDVRRVQRHAHRKALVARMRELKLAPCVDCGRSFHPVAMTFDHRPGATKVDDLSNLARRGCTGLFELELEKCDLVCANCHAIRTYLRSEAETAGTAGGPGPRVSDPPELYASAA